MTTKSGLLIAAFLRDCSFNLSKGSHTEDLAWELQDEGLCRYSEHSMRLTDKGIDLARKLTLAFFSKDETSKASNGPFHDLIDSVAAAIKHYDTTLDHLAHSPNADCVRCQLESVIKRF